MFKLLVVNYHYYRPENYRSGIYPVSPKRFVSQIDSIGRRYQFVGQRKLLSWVRTRTYPDGKYCLLTFDDGLKEQLSAYKLLKEKSIKPILFVPSKPLMEHTVLSVHKLHYIRSKWDDKKLMEVIQCYCGNRMMDVDMRSAIEQYRYDNELAQRTKYVLNFILTEAEREAVIGQCFRELVDNEDEFVESLYISEEDLKILAMEGVLGSHGHGHIPFRQVDAVLARNDIVRSIQYLEKICGKPIVSFSYPFGSHIAVDENICTYFEGTNVQVGFTMWRGLNDRDNMNQPLLLNRFAPNDIFEQGNKLIGRLNMG